MAETNTCRGILNECKDEFNRGLKKLQEGHLTYVNILEKNAEPLFQKLKKLAKTGDFKAAGLESLRKDFDDSSDQENVPNKRGRGRKKKPVLAENTEDNLQVKIKKEKISISSQSNTARSSESLTVPSVPEIPVTEIKSEQIDMPAPSWIPPKKKNKEAERASTRTTRTKGKKADIRDSDVVVQNSTITTISLSDSEESEVEKSQPIEQKTSRSTRTKTKKAQAESDSGADTDNESTRSTRTKTRNKKQQEESNESCEVEETRSTRTKTIRKGKKAEDQIKNEPEEQPPAIRSTRTRPIKKGQKLLEESSDASTTSNKKEETILAVQPEPTKTARTTMKNVTEKNTEEVVATSDSQKTNEDVNAKVPKSRPKRSKEGQSKRNRSDNSTDEEANHKKRSKSISPVQGIDGNGTVQTVYEDARSTVGAPKENNHLDSTYVANARPVPGFKKIAQVPPLNATVTIEPTTSNAANCTVVVDKPQFNLFDNKSIDAMFTDDDSIEYKKTPPKKAPNHKASKEVFSPYEKTTLKKKVEAFEKLQSGSEIPVKSSANLRSNRDTPSKVREKAKIFTPLGYKFMPSSSSTSKVSRFINHTTSNDGLVTKSAHKESRDRQNKLMEREQAQKKKEAMLLAQAEAKRKVNEEKQLKAQQQRKLLDAEKQKVLEAQKLKEARQEQKDREREEYLQKQKLEREKKRIEQKKKLAEVQAQRQQILDEQAKHPPIYMTTKLPRLPTTDCYDSDDPDYQRVEPPKWCQGEYLKRKQLVMLAAGEKIKNTLFCRHAQSPDLTEIFQVIDPTKLKRSSSVLWRKPPRYTMMPDLNDTKFEEDDELFDD